MSEDDLNANVDQNALAVINIVDKEGANPHIAHEVDGSVILPILKLQIDAEGKSALLYSRDKEIHVMSEDADFVGYLRNASQSGPLSKCFVRLIDMEFESDGKRARGQVVGKVYAADDPIWEE
ncbi:hypothetical protein [Paracoccus sp. MKU1]|uniref:hypothetical protein n=1 Tax=Paracoccus sp. MKU1 TaxID=1745182 RepID=UPI0007191DD4|nr:hypothetical protein [Paracoccus sp. MKU1]KRW94327.1 hypothetical protein AQY21_20575 [Paracoccus sp. MKU1]